MMTTVIFGGDIYPDGNVQKAFIEGNADEIFHDLLDDIVTADLSVANLECPLISNNTPITKAGSIMGANVACIQGFITAGWHILNLANNHSFDHGTIGLQETIETIKRAGITYVGAGVNIAEAQKPIVKEINGQRIVIHAMAEHEYSIADEKTAGANPLDIINFVYAIRQYKQRGIFVVLIHGGKEYYPYPSPEMVRRCRFMVSMGADAVICCHAHCPQPWEIYNGKPIVYGLGNLIFESSQKEPDSWHKGYMARLTFEDQHVQFEALPYMQSREYCGAKKMDSTQRKLFFEDMERKSTHLKNNAFIEEQWVNHCRQKKYGYLMELFGYKRLMKKIGQFLIPRMHSKEEILTALHLTQCETHLEVLNTLFKDERR